MFPVSLKKGSKTEREAVACIGTRVIDPESQRSYLTILLMREIKHEVVRRINPSDVRDIEQKERVKVGGRRGK